ncbi:MAG: extracellular solute-binding protein [Clostridia bacterium]|nr:extracellular solute-binding protein [Clostridia bacterium]
MKARQPIAALLLIAMLSAAACGSQADTPVDPTAGSDTTTTTEAVTESTRLEADIPADADYEGYEFRVLSRAKAGSWENYDIEIESSNGEVINDALYERNQTVEELLNVKFKQIPVNGYDVKTPANTSIMSGSDDYDIIMPSITDAANFAQNGMLTPLQELPYMNLENPWYDQRCIEELQVNGKNYMFFSDITVRNLDAIWIYLFNKQIIDDYQLEDPYELVTSGKWTTEKMTEMCKAVTNDVNGDTKMDKSDSWGLVAHDYVITAGYVGSGERIATADKNGEITLTMNNQRIYDVIDSLIVLQDYWIRYSLTAKKYSAAAPVGFEPSDNYAELLSVFKAGNALFIGECMAVMSDMRDSDIEFGVVPTPKLDEDQDGYYSAVNYIAASMCVPKTVTNLERTSVIIEAWAAESHYTVIPAYYEIAMKSKYARDTVTSEMLDLILGSRSYDLGIYYGWGGLSDRFCSLVYEASTDFASMYDANKGTAQDALDTFTKNFE